MAVSTNLALRPFRNERLPWLLALLILLVGVMVSLVHARFISRLLSGTEADTVRRVREDETRVADLESNIAKEPPLRLATAEISRLRAFKDLVDRRVFPWRLLMTDLEGILSEDVRLTSISPETSKDGRGIKVELLGEARTKDAAFSFAEALEAAPAFSSTVLKSLSEEDRSIRFSVQAVFEPRTSQDAGLKPLAGADVSPSPATSPTSIPSSPHSRRSR